MSAGSTRFSRRVYVGVADWLPPIRILGDDEPFTHEPYWAEIGVYRAELDPETHTATITEEEA